MTHTRKRKAKRVHTRLSKARLDRLVEEAVVDCNNESEQIVARHAGRAETIREERDE
jgi:hypothetical protein